MPRRANFLRHSEAQSDAHRCDDGYSCVFVVLPLSLLLPAPCQHVLGRNAAPHCDHPSQAGIEALLEWHQRFDSSHGQVRSRSVAQTCGLPESTIRGKECRVRISGEKLLRLPWLSAAAVNSCRMTQPPQPWGPKAQRRVKTGALWHRNWPGYRLHARGSGRYPNVGHGPSPSSPLKKPEPW